MKLFRHYAIARIVGSFSQLLLDTSTLLHHTAVLLRPSGAVLWMVGYVIPRKEYPRVVTNHAALRCARERYYRHSERWCS